MPKMRCALGAIQESGVDFRVARPLLVVAKPRTAILVLRRPGVSNPKDVEAGLASAKFESSASRLLPTWMYTLYNVLYVIGSNIIFVTTGE